MGWQIRREDSGPACEDRNSSISYYVFLTTKFLNMKWEYNIIYINATKWTSTGLPDDLNDKFDDLGKKGWDLVKIEPKLESGFINFGSFTSGYVAFFKRALNS